MKTFVVIYYNVLKTIRDWKYMLILIIAPLVLIYITGFAADKITEYYMHLKPGLAYYIDNSDPGAKKSGTAFEGFLQSDGIGKAIKAVPASSFDQGYDMARNGEVDTLVVFAKNGVETYSTQLLNPVNTLVQGFANLMPSSSQPAKETAKAGLNAIDPPANAMRQLDLWTYQGMVIFLFYGSIIGAYSLINERSKNLTGRIRSAPVAYSTNITGIVVAQFITIFASAIFIIAFTAVFYGSNWNGSLVNILGAFGLFSLFASGMGTFLALVLKRFAVIVVLLMCLNATLTMGPGLSAVSPSSHTLSIIEKTIFGGSSAEIGHSMLILGLVSVGLASMSVLTGRLKKV